MSNRRKIPNQLRRKVEDALETLIALLDEVEPDPELEDTADDEPWLGAPPPMGHALDVEDDASETEPSLGSLDRHIDQDNWSKGNSTWGDFEHEHDGREPDEDKEPSLGSIATSERDSQELWSAGINDDREAEEDQAVPDGCIG